MKPSYYLLTLGCQMNYADSDQLHQLLQDFGFQRASAEKDADLIIINACSVRQKAVDRIWGKLHIWHKITPKPALILTGCVLPADYKKFKEKFDFILPIGQLDEFNNFIIKKFPNLISNSSLVISNSSFCPIYDRPIGEKDAYYIPIMEGCNNFCSYCAVPFTRGREKSRPEKEILDDVKQALKMGYKRIVLLGQNVNSYGKSGKSLVESHQSNFKDLLLKIDNIPCKFQLNFLTSHPKDLSKDLIKTLTKLKKWEHNLHLPLQSGDDQILSKMNRRYTAKHYLDLISKLKAQMSNLKISTDIIVGFPGETKKQFQNTVSLCKKIKFDKAYIAKFSPRPGTAASYLKDDVPLEEKKRRWKILNDLINK